jgi:hypothetical protein
MLLEREMRFCSMYKLETLHQLYLPMKPNFVSLRVLTGIDLFHC